MLKAPGKIQRQLARTKKKSGKKEEITEEEKPAPSVVDLADLSEDEIMELIPRLSRK